MKTLRVVLLLMAAGTVWWACGTGLAAGQRARLLALQGLVKVKTSGTGSWQKAALPRNASLGPQDEVQTYQKAHAKLGYDGTLIEMGPLTHVIIPGTSPSRGRTPSRLNLITGKILIWLIGAHPLEIGTAGAIACAKSTQFIVEADQTGHTTLTVIEGAVQFYNDRGSVLVAANQQSTAAPGVAPSHPARTDRSGVIDFEASLDNLWLDFERLSNPEQTREGLRQGVEAALQKAAAAPLDAAAQETAADLLHDSGRLDEAAAAYQRALELTPGNAAVGLKVGYNLLAQGCATEAGAVFEKLAAAAPRSPAPLVGKALALAASTTDAKLAAARDTIGQALNLDGSNPEAVLATGVIALRRGQASEARTGLSRAAQAKDPDYRALAYLSMVQLADNEPQDALTSARKAVALAPASALAHGSLGMAAFYCGATTEARAEAALALELNPNSATAHLLASHLAVIAGDLDMGLAQAEAAVELDPCLASAHQAIGMMALTQNDLKRAEKSFNKALALQPRLVSAQTGRGLLYARQDKLAAALQQQQGAVALEAGSAAARNNLGVVYLQTGRLTEALAAFTEALRLQPDWALPYGNLALAHLERYEYAQALAAAEKAVALGGDSARVRTTLARVYLRQERVNAAWAQLRRALELDPDYALARMHLAEVYTTMGRPEDAVRERFKALSQQPSVMVDNRAYARTEISAAGGDSTLLNAKIMGRGDEGQNAYYLSTGYAATDWDRPRTDATETTAVGIFGRQTAAAETAVLYLTGESQHQERPGAAVGAALDPTDDDYTSKFRGFEGQVLSRRRAGRKADLTIRAGWSRERQRSTNPDSLLGDPKPFPYLELMARGPAAEVRFDKAYAPGELLTLGAAWMEKKQSVEGLIGDPGTPPLFTPFSNTDLRNIGTGYLEYQRLLNSRTTLLVGGRAVCAEGVKPVLRPKAALHYQLSGHSTLSLLTRPTIADDVSELAPVDPYALRPYLSPLDLARGGYSQSYELQYERNLPSGVMRAALFQRNARNLLVDLEDPSWSLEAAPLVLGEATLQGAEVEYERQCGRDLSAGLWARYTDASNDDPGGGDLPYQPEAIAQARLDYLNAAGWRLGATWSFVGRRYADTANTVRLGSFGLLGIKLARQCNLHTDVFVNIENALDRDYEYFRGYPGRGVQFSGGVKYRF